MRLGALTSDVLRTAVTLYQDHAYGAGRARRGFEVPSGEKAESLLAMFHKETVEPIPGHPCVRYSLRLGNRNYPFMKLLLQEHLVAGEFFFSVDTHDQMDIKPDYPDYEAFLAVRKFNRELKRSIEASLEAHGLDTAASLSRLVQGREGAAPRTCRGLVLVVDDEADLADAVEVLLQRQGFRTARAADGLAGLEAATRLAPDLVLLDYEMPELDGLEVIARLRANPVTQGIPVILSSAARVSMADIRRADGFLAKPFQEGLLHDMIDRVLRNTKEARA